MPAVDVPQEANGPSPSSGEGAARRSRPIYRVFVSSTWLDLQPERRALMEALNRMDEMRFVGMEFFGNRPDDTHDASIDQVDLCEVFVGIIGHRYGSGITEAEYRRARGLNLPCFAYFKRGETADPEHTDQDPALAARLSAFKQELLRGHTVKEFASPEELAANATADLHNWVAARWISLEREQAAARPRSAAADADRTNALRLIERVDQDWVKGVLEASLHHRAWLELGLDWREDAVEHPWDRIVVAPDRPIQTLSKQDSITGVFDAAQHTLLVLGEPGAGKTTTVLELARDLISRARESAAEPVPAVLALSNWRGQHKDLAGWLVGELGLRYQVPKRVATNWLEEGRLVLILDGLDEVIPERRGACVAAINAFEQAHHPPGLAVTCRVAEYEALPTKLRLRSAICLQPLTPEQIDRYFRVAGASLDPLREALREDAGLRDLARSPLMLSVMTMAWRDAPVGTKAPFAATRTPEELRRNLFDAYVQSALKRRGKATGQYTPEQTVKWLTWLARRMKENGHTLFAIEQLQPGWLDGAWRQFGYFVATRVLGTVGLMLPLLLFNKLAVAQKPGFAALGLGVGCYMGVIDFALARHGWGGYRRAAVRLWTQLAGLIGLAVGLIILETGDRSETVAATYLVLVMVAFCAPVDVRGLDIKPTGSMQWSWRLGLERGLAALVITNLIMVLVFAIDLVGRVAKGGWPEETEKTAWQGLAAIGVATVLTGLGWARLRPVRTWWNITRAATLAMIGAQITWLLVFADRSSSAWAAILPEFIAPVMFGVFAGFGSTLIDPARPQQAGAWFWLRVPVTAFLVVGLVMTMPVLMVATALRDQPKAGDLAEVMAIAAGVGGVCGLVAFLRFGGFNGAQHFILRWLLARTGRLPVRPEAFLNHAAQLALLQKVGLGYRFVHALLLQHLATLPGERAEPAVAAAADPRAASSRRARVWWAAAGLGLGVGVFLLGWLAVGGFAFARGLETQRYWYVEYYVLGVLVLWIVLAVPLLLLTGRWLARRSWRWLGAGYLGLGLTMAYLAVDEPPAPRLAGLVEVDVALPNAEKFSALLRSYDPGGSGEKLTGQWRWTSREFTERPEFGQQWQDFVISHRAEIEANWQKLVVVRQWAAELNSFERFDELMPRQFARDAIFYRVASPWQYNGLAMAALQALDGQGDAALLTLLPILEVGGKIEDGAQTSWSLYTGRLLQDGAIRAAEFVLDHARPSPAVRARFAAALTAHGGGRAGARRLYVKRYAALARATQSLGSFPVNWSWTSFDPLKPVLDLLGPVAFNRQATLNRWGELLADLGEFAARREPDKAQQRATDFLAHERRVRFKNIGAMWVLWMGEGAMGVNDVGGEQKRYWETEDRRTALFQRLQQPERK